MPTHAPTVTDFWRTMFHGDVRYRSEALTVTANPGLSHDRRAMVLETVDGSARLVLTVSVADRLNLSGHPGLAELRRRLADLGIAFHGADHLFYFTEAEKDRLLTEEPGDDVRRLTGEDRELFAAFTSGASASDLDDAYVELDHWAVFGAVEDDRLVTVASMYPWRQSVLADVGVLTLPPFRGRGHARHVIRAISRYAYGRAHHPQYRCQLDNLASVALAKSAGLTRFGTWDVVAQ